MPHVPVTYNQVAGDGRAEIVLDGGVFTRPTPLFLCHSWYRSPPLPPEEAETGPTNSVYRTENEIATSLGLPVNTRIFHGNHGYQNSTTTVPNADGMPTDFDDTVVKGDPARGWTHSLLNMKFDIWKLAAGDYDQAITDLGNSVPTGHTLFLVINHEPEDEETVSLTESATLYNPVTWRKGQARIANLVAANDNPKLHFAFCLMSFTWKDYKTPKYDAFPEPRPVRDPAHWDFSGLLTDAARSRTIFAPDGYTPIYNVSGTHSRSIRQEFEPMWIWARQRGFQRFGINEHNINNDINAPAAKVAEKWSTDVAPYILNEIPELVYYGWYHTNGPASGTNYLADTDVERTAVGKLALACKNPAPNTGVVRLS